MSVYNLSGNDNGIQQAPLSFVRAGGYGYSNGNLSSRGSDGGYWESRAYSSTYANLLLFSSTYLGTQLNSYKGHGFSVRCVVR